MTRTGTRHIAGVCECAPQKKLRVQVMSQVEAVKSREAMRFEILGDRQATLEIEPVDLHSEASLLAARLVNLSSKGAKLSVSEDLPRNRAIRMKLAVDELGLSFYLATRVCWTTKGENGSWFVGCELSPNVPESILKHVTEGGRLERREDDRRPVVHEVGVCRKTMFRTKEDLGVLRNFASGGMCVSTTAPAKLGEKLAMRFGRLAEIPLVEVVVRWQMQQGEHYLIGCEYADPGSFAMLNSLLK
ncbi:MAG: hypothetical protein C0483_04985 [Pirellula sp.]|nr:hypothetical protein [Pirellula sp.]